MALCLITLLGHRSSLGLPHGERNRYGKKRKDMNVYEIIRIREILYVLPGSF